MSKLYLVIVSAALASCSGVGAGAKSPKSAALTTAADCSQATEPGAEPSKFDARLSLYPYPFDVAVHRFTSQSQALEMAYMDVAPSEPTSKPAIVLLHGKNFSGAYWERTIASLRDAGHRVIAPDQIGFGKSSKPTTYQFSFQQLAHNTAGLLDHLGIDSVVVVGHSMGGMLATRFAQMYPQRTTKLALVNPIGLEDWQQVVPYPGIDSWEAAELAKTPAGVRAYMQKSYFDGKWEPSYDAIADIQVGWTTSPDRETLAKVSALTYDMIFTQPVVYEFSQVKAPTLLIVGTRDRTALGKNLVAPEIAAEMGRYERLGKAADQSFPNSNLIEVEGVGHIPQIEAWDVYIAALTAFAQPQVP